MVERCLALSRRSMYLVRARHRIFNEHFPRLSQSLINLKI